MPNIPGISGSVPVVFGPTGRSIEKHPKGYAIGWDPHTEWGGPNFIGNLKELARNLILIYSKTLSYEGNYKPIEEINNPGYTSISDFLINFKSMDCRLVGNCSCKDNIDEEVFLRELSEELAKLKTLMVFA